MSNHRTQTRQHTFLKASSVAIHLAFEPHIRNSEKSNPSLTIAGCMSPFTECPTGFGSPKCEKMRRPRDIPPVPSSIPTAPLTVASFCADVLEAAPPTLASPGNTLREGVDGCFGLGVVGGAADPPAAGAATPTFCF